MGWEAYVCVCVQPRSHLMHHEHERSCTHARTHPCTHVQPCSHLTHTCTHTQSCMRGFQRLKKRSWPECVCIVYTSTQYAYTVTCTHTHAHTHTHARARMHTPRCITHCYSQARLSAVGEAQLDTPGYRATGLRGNHGHGPAPHSSSMNQTTREVLE